MGSCHESPILQLHCESSTGRVFFIVKFKGLSCPFIAIQMHKSVFHITPGSQDFLFIAQVSQFMQLLGVKPTPQKDLQSFPILTHPESLKLPTNFDARTAWPQCNTIGRILGYLLLFIYMLLFSVSLI